MGKQWLGILIWVPLTGCVPVCIGETCVFTPAEERFLEKFNDRFCEEAETCNPDLGCDFVEDDEDTMEALEDCEYDGAAAADCLNGEWRCNSEFEGFEFPEPPVDCNFVFDCEGTDVGGTERGTVTGTTTGTVTTLD